MARPARLIFLLFLFAFLAGRTASAGDALARLVVPLARPSAVREAAQRAVADALAGVPPPADGHPAHLVTPGGAYVLHGDLFGTGEHYALAELNSPVGPEGDPNASGFAFARWDGRAWELRGLWRIAPTWRPAGWQNGETDYLPIRPAETPFILEDFSGDGVPEVIVAGEVDKYYQEHYLLRFDPAARRLNFVADAMARPVAVGGFVRLHFNSGRRAIWEGWVFLSWRDGHLVERASWHEESPYNNVDPPFTIATRNDVPGQRSVRFRVVAEGGWDENNSTYRIIRNGRPFARVSFHWPGAKEAWPTDSDAMDRYLFSHLTGLPAALFPIRLSGDAPVRPAPTPRAVVTGRPSAVRLLSNAPPRRKFPPTPPFPRATPSDDP